jgi:NAD(P)-dependent dehydrogenase (short-subunit alcohol dehydrogenase family)
MAQLAGKIAFITDAGTEIARATAILFAREGAKWLLRARLRAKSGGITGLSEG